VYDLIINNNNAVYAHWFVKRYPASGGQGLFLPLTAMVTKTITGDFALSRYLEMSKSYPTVLGIVQ